MYDILILYVNPKKKEGSIYIITKGKPVRKSRGEKGDWNIPA